MDFGIRIIGIATWGERRSLMCGGTGPRSGPIASPFRRKRMTPSGWRPGSGITRWRLRRELKQRRTGWKHSMIPLMTRQNELIVFDEADHRAWLRRRKPELDQRR